MCAVFQWSCLKCVPFREVSLCYAQASVESRPKNGCVPKRQLLVKSVTFPQLYTMVEIHLFIDSYSIPNSTPTRSPYKPAMR